MHILNYIIPSILAILFGQVVGHLCKKMPPVVAEEISYKEFFRELFKDFKIDIKYTFIHLILFNMFVYFNVNLLYQYLYILLIPVLIIVFYIDFKYQLIPDEAHIWIIVLSLIKLIFNLNNWYSYVLGALIGGGIFLALGYLALFIYKKEGMGFGDVKLMAALGLFFGIKYILVIALLSFVFGAVVGIILISTKQKRIDSYIPFGPFIVISTVLIMYINPNDIIFLYISFCTLLGRKITDIVYYLMGNKN